MKRECKPARNNRVWVWLLGISLAANAMLLGLGRRSRAETPATVPAPREIGAPRSPQPQAPDVGPAPRLLTRALPFHWSQLESEDFAVYIANLRAAGCPEALVRDLLAVELRDLYEAPASRDPAAEAFWTSGEERVQRERERQVDRRARDLECRAVYRSLLGVDLPPSDMTSEGEVALMLLVLDHLTPERRGQVVTLVQDLEARAELARAETEGWPPSRRRERLSAVYRDWRNQALTQFGPTEFEELALRASVLSLDPVPAGLEGIRLTGAEARQVFRTLWGDLDPHWASFVREYDLEPGVRRDDLDDQPDRQAQIAALLGRERGGQYLRNLDPTFGPLGDFSREHHLAETVTQRLYEAQQLAAETAADVRNDPTLSAAERTARLEAVEAALTVVVQQNLVADLASTYLERSAGWRQEKFGPRR